ncbi:hypothetical protein [Amycolatopsis sp. CA-128772]|uniref:hypothetical protein n=1 Tax=Amycolatopsis sp. CA-128772 TaxID=2073159 RepID=UPI001304A721|nr:hypothetical protein [Amycolatopsis sp. CA-128772]
MTGTAPREVVIQRIPATGGFCWSCQQTAVSGERLPGRHHRVRLLCRQHDQAVFNPPAGPSHQSR